MILTDTDLFPAGDHRLNGVKVYGEELGKVSLMRRQPPVRRLRPGAGL